MRIGTLGAARITPPALIAPAAKNDDVEVVAVAARDRVRAEAFAAEHGIGTVYDDYQALIDAPDLDAIYNPLPPSEHHPWTIAALRSGKHVLCEKPFASNADEAAEMVAVATETDRVLVEAFHWRYHPLADRVLAILAAGEIGTIERIEAAFCAPFIPETDIRYSYVLGGGALMDLGCYATQWVRVFTGEEPTVVSAEAVEGPKNIDLRLTAELDFPSGATGQVHTSMHPEDTMRADCRITGSTGSMHIVNPLAPQMGHAIVVRPAGGEERTETVEGRDTYDHQLEAFVAAVRDGVEVPTGGEDSIATMAAIDSMYRAAGLPPRGT